MDTSNHRTSVYCETRMCLKELSLFCIDLFATFLLFSLSTTESAFKHWKMTCETVNDMGRKHVPSLMSLTRYETGSFCLDFLYSWFISYLSHFVDSFIFSMITLLNCFCTEMHLTALSNMILRFVLQGLQLSKMWQGIVMISLSILTVSVIL